MRVIRSLIASLPSVDLTAGLKAKLANTGGQARIGVFGHATVETAQRARIYA